MENFEQQLLYWFFKIKSTFLLKNFPLKLVIFAFISDHFYGRVYSKLVVLWGTTIRGLFYVWQPSMLRHCERNESKWLFSGKSLPGYLQYVHETVFSWTRSYYTVTLSLLTQFVWRLVFKGLLFEEKLMCVWTFILWGKYLHMHSRPDMYKPCVRGCDYWKEHWFNLTCSLEGCNSLVGFICINRHPLMKQTHMKWLHMSNIHIVWSSFGN